MRKHAVNRQTDDRLVRIGKAVDGVMVKATTNYAPALRRANAVLPMRLG